MSPPNWQFRADPTMQIDVNMSPPSCSAVPTFPSPHIINLEASPPRCSTYLSHANNLTNITIINPFFSPTPHRQPPQGIRLDALLPLMSHTGIDLDASPPRHTPLHLAGMAASQPRPTLGSTTQSPLLTKPSGLWPLALRAQSLAQLIARAWSIQAEQSKIHQSYSEQKLVMQADEFNADARHEIDDGDQNLTFDICHSAKSERQMANDEWQMAKAKVGQGNRGSWAKVNIAN
ncbi:hypothetical protein BDN67DRAFT_984477 [Paxillus ammoniavirescens]|nr:hypothetical protein BDN67DRAFT_984477 [Paxillus ammoniavirescens]